MYAEVVVLTYQPPKIQTYTYRIPKSLEIEVKPGQIVTVPFGKRNPTGLVVSTNNQPNAIIKNIKPIGSVQTKKPILLPYQIKLLRWLSEFYIAPLVNCLEAILPQVTKTLPNQTSTSSSLQQSIILVQSISHIPQILAKYPQAKSHTVYHNQLTPNEKLNAWQKILNSNCDYIFGTRSAIFTPCPNLKEIIIYNEHDDSYKDERSPYFNTLTVAEKISQLTGSEIKIIDYSPRITTYFSHRNELTVPKISTKTKTVSMLEEKMSGNRSPISGLLKEYLKLAHKNQKGVLLFLNKKSESGHIYCKDCKNNDFLIKAPQICPNCGSQNIWYNSFNVSSLKKEVEKIVPAAKINILVEGHTKIPSIGPTIDIATASIFYKLSAQKYDLVVDVAADQTLNISDFPSQEKTYQKITNLKIIAKGLLLIQTYNPEHPTIQSAAKSDYASFFKKNIEERKVLKYPPFVLLIKLTLKGKNVDILESKSMDLSEKLQYAHDKYPLMSAHGPYKPFFTKNTTRYNIVLKVQLKNYSLEEKHKALAAIMPLLSKIPPAWQIEVEPISLN